MPIWRLILLIFVSLYLGICIGIYVRVFSTQKIKYTFLPSFIAPIFCVSFVCYVYKRAKQDNDHEITKFTLLHLDDVMFLFIALIGLIRTDQHKGKTKKSSFDDFNNEILTDLKAY